MRRFKYAVLFLTLFSCASFAGKPDDVMWNTNGGPYFGAALGVNTVTLQAGKKRLAGFSGFASTINVGYMFTRHYGIDAGTTVYFTGIYATHIAAKAVLPIDGRLSVFALAGVIYTRANGTTGLWNPVLGVGTGYMLSPRLQITGALTGISIGTGSHQSAQLGTLMLGMNYYL